MQEERYEMLLEGIQRKGLSKICSGVEDKPTSIVDGENALEKVFGSKYWIRLDHQILTDHRVIYPQALFDDLVFELTLAPALQVVMGSKHPARV